MEYIDLYSRDGSLLRRHVPRDASRAPGECYRHVHVLLFDRAGNCLLQLRSIKKKFFPGEWGVTGGGVQSGETSREAGVREVREELGLTVPEDALRLIGSRLDDTVGGALLDVYAVRLDFSESDCRLLDGEVDAVRLLPYGEFVEMVCQRQDAVYRGILEKAGKIMLPEKNYTDLNAETIGSWVRSGWEWGRPVDHETCERARAGEWSVLLSPTIPVPKDWFGELRGKKLLGLASGGGQQMPLFAIAGADCTLLDYCPEQLESDQMVAEREGLSIHIVRGDMTRRLPFEDASFDIIFHPVSNCYIEDVQHVWNECFRVLRPGGRLLAGLDNGMNFVFDEEGVLQHRLPYNPLKDPALLEESLKKGEGVQFSHSIEEQIGGQLKAGFRLLDLYSDIDPFGWSQKYNLPAYWVTLAEKEVNSEE